MYTIYSLKCTHTGYSILTIDYNTSTYAVVLYMYIQYNMKHKLQKNNSISQYLTKVLGICTYIRTWFIIQNCDCWCGWYASINNTWFVKGFINPHCECLRLLHYCIIHGRYHQDGWCITSTEDHSVRTRCVVSDICQVKGREEKVCMRSQWQSWMRNWIELKEKWRKEKVRHVNEIYAQVNE